MKCCLGLCGLHEVVLKAHCLEHVSLVWPPPKAANSCLRAMSEHISGRSDGSSGYR